MKARCIAIVLLAALATPAMGDPIGRLASGAYCRDEKGVVRDPHVTPQKGAEAHRAGGGMIKTDEPVSGADCYFYHTEVALKETMPCPSAAVGKTASNIAGTLGGNSCNAK
jgi:hypothetical protein